MTTTTTIRNGVSTNDHLPQRAALEGFLEGLRRRDFGAIRKRLDPGVRFRALIPPGVSEATSAEAAVDSLREWFADLLEFELIDWDVEPLADRLHLTYRIRGRDEEGVFLVQQQVYCDVAEGRITTMDLLCSGFRHVPQTVGGVHHYDAGSLGCTDGLAQEFRRRIGAIPIGDILAVLARDPSAKADLPPLARLMGHRVRSIEPTGDGAITITVERGK